MLYSQLSTLFTTMDQNNQLEREGVAKAYGFAGSSHLDSVIEKLSQLTNNDMVAKSTGFLGLMKDKSDVDVVRIKSTIMLAYGYLALYAPPNLITSVGLTFVWLYIYIKR